MWLLEHTAACPDSSDWPGRGTSDKGTGDLCGKDGMGAGQWQFRFQRHGPVLNWCFVDGHAKAYRYADLWRGGETLAPILLVLGYCVFVPLAILR